MTFDESNCSVFGMQIATANATIFIDSKELQRCVSELAAGQQPECPAGSVFIHLGNAAQANELTPEAVTLQFLEDIGNPALESYRVRLIAGEICPGLFETGDEGVISVPRRQICFPNG